MRNTSSPSSCRGLGLVTILAIALLVVMGCAGRSSEADATPLVATASPASTSSPTPSPENTQASSATPTRTVAPPTSTATPTVLVSPTPGPTVAPDLALEFSTLKPNQYLGYVAQRYGVSLDELVQFSGIDNPDVVLIGQGLIIPHHTDRYTPDEVLLPDSELVYGQGYVDFDLHAFVAQQGGRLAQVSMAGLDGETWSGADVVERVAARYSVGPRVLLALMEAGSGWVTDPDPQGNAADYPLAGPAAPTGVDRRRAQPRLLRLAGPR